MRGTATPWRALSGWLSSDRRGIGRRNCQLITRETSVTNIPDGERTNRGFSIFSFRFCLPCEIGAANFPPGKFAFRLPEGRWCLRVGHWARRTDSPPDYRRHKYSGQRFNSCSIGRDKNRLITWPGSNHEQPPTRGANNEPEIVRRRVSDGTAADSEFGKCR